MSLFRRLGSGQELPAFGGFMEFYAKPRKDVARGRRSQRLQFRSAPRAGGIIVSVRGNEQTLVPIADTTERYRQSPMQWCAKVERTEVATENEFLGGSR